MWHASDVRPNPTTGHVPARSYTRPGFLLCAVSDTFTRLIKRTQIIKNNCLYKTRTLITSPMLEGSQRGVSPTDVHDILRNERRRRAIKCLLESEGAVSVRDLSERIAEMETGESPPPSEVRKSVYVTLHQNHLSKLEEAGVVRCDSNEVEPGERIDEVKKYVTYESEDDGTAWAEVCALLSLLGVVAVGGVIFAMEFNVVSAGVGLLAVLFFMAIFAVSLYVVVSNRNDG